MKGLRNLVVATAGAGLLSACATVAPIPPSPATVDYAGKDCVSMPDLATAISLTPDEERALFSVNAPTAGSCLTRPDGGTTPYVAFALPADFADKTVIVGSLLEPLRILSPSVAILDRDGAVTRSFETEDFLYRGPVFSVQFRPRETEAYVLVTTDPVRVGQRYDSIVVGVVTTTISTGYGSSQWRSGAETAQSRMFSWEGMVQVSLADSDTKEEDPAR